ncbi:outer membrane protein transport protein [uncultured Fibrella sp.]|uniref:outer membrane protein transport protein n=1 Tax=uncultured Fibrella sp. TaxID=1284596 RepID=UPI0035CC9983
MKNLILLAAGLSLLTTSTLRAQGLGNSPYSALGLGEILPATNVANIGMGGVGVSYASPFYLNSQNPALLARRTRFTIFEIGLLGQQKTISQLVQNEPLTQRDFGANLSYLALAFPLSSRWNTAISLRPYSYVDYKTRTYGKIPGTIYETQFDYSGKGALNRASISNGVRLGKNIYLGADASFIFGNISSSSDAQVLINSSSDLVTSRVNRVNYSDIVWNLGAAWRPTLGKNYALNIGATFAPKSNLSGTETDVYQQLTASGGSVVSGSDTLRSNSDGRVPLPQHIQFGITLEKNNQLAIGVEAGMQSWSQFRTITDQPGNLRDAFHSSVGVEFTPKPTSTRYRDLITYRAGFQYNQLPYQVQGVQLKDVNGSLGFSIPVGAYFVNHINLAFVAGQRGVLTGAQIRERYFKVAVGFSLNDWWFRKTVID